jgi:hypothetical protein
VGAFRPAAIWGWIGRAPVRKGLGGGPSDNWLVFAKGLPQSILYSVDLEESRPRCNIRIGDQAPGPRADFSTRVTTSATQKPSRSYSVGTSIHGIGRTLFRQYPPWAESVWLSVFRPSYVGASRAEFAASAPAALEQAVSDDGIACGYDALALPPLQSELGANMAQNRYP